MGFVPISRPSDWWNGINLLGCHGNRTRRCLGARKIAGRTRVHVFMWDSWLWSLPGLLSTQGNPKSPPRVVPPKMKTKINEIWCLWILLTECFSINKSLSDKKLPLSAISICVFEWVFFPLVWKWFVSFSFRIKKVLSLKCSIFSLWRWRNGYSSFFEEEETFNSSNF